MLEQEAILEQLRSINYDNLGKQEIVTILDIGDLIIEKMARSRVEALDLITKATTLTKETLKDIKYSEKVEAEIRNTHSLLRELLIKDGI